MVGVSTGLGGNFPCLIPGEVILIHQYTHKLCDSHGRVGIVELEGNFLIELADIAVVAHVLLYSLLNGCADEEILLL